MLSIESCGSSGLLRGHSYLVKDLLILGDYNFIDGGFFTIHSGPGQYIHEAHATPLIGGRLSIVFQDCHA